MGHNFISWADFLIISMNKLPFLIPKKLLVQLILKDFKKFQFIYKT